MTAPSSPSHQWDAIWWAIFDWRESVQGADSGALADRVNRAIADTVQQQVAAALIARAEHESTADHENV